MKQCNLLDLRTPALTTVRIERPAIGSKTLCTTITRSALAVIVCVNWIGPLCGQTTAALPERDIVSLPGTEPLLSSEALDVKLMREAHAFVEQQIAFATERKSIFWQRDFSSVKAYDASIQPNRKRLRALLGMNNWRRQPHTHLAFARPKRQIAMYGVGDALSGALIHETSSYEVRCVRWPALDRVNGEGLLLMPKSPHVATVVVVPDADQSPEQLAGIVPGIRPTAQLARRLAQNRIRVIVPMLINRSDAGALRKLGISNREWIYRQAFHMGRHIIGYELEKLEAALAWIELTQTSKHPIGICGWGEGAQLAFFTAALNPQVDVTLASDDWASRTESWRQPIYRNIWNYMSEFGDLELATMIAPRRLIIEQCRSPKIDVKRDKAAPASAPVPAAVVPAAVVSAAGQRVSAWRSEWAAENPGAQRTTPGEGRGAARWQNWFHYNQSKGGSTAQQPADFYREETVQLFANGLGIQLATDDHSDVPERRDIANKIRERHARQLVELDDYTQRLIRDSGSTREKYFLNQALPLLQDRSWSTKAVHPTSSVNEFTAAAQPFREKLWNGVLGKFDLPLIAAAPRTRLIQESEVWRAYDVVLDVVPNLFAWGILVVPRDLEDGKQRPLVVVQHGRNGLPIKVLNGGYNGIVEKLLRRGYVVFAPHNLYRGEDKYRWLDRKANAIGKSLFSILILQHDQLTRWLASLPMVDADRIAFYGNSYGGESAVRIPTVLTQYCLSICASDFNDWTRKVADTHDPHSFMNTIEWEMPYFGMGDTFSYAELAYLMIPRPFMVERGHHDRVAPDAWVASEYAKVRLVYDQLGIGDRTEISFFQGGHTMRGEATLEFLDRHLKPSMRVSDKQATN